jgi:hypothetical protein
VSVLGLELTHEEAMEGVSLLVEIHGQYVNGHDDYGAVRTWSAKVKEWDAKVNDRRRRELLADAFASDNPTGAVLAFLHREGFISA